MNMFFVVAIMLTVLPAEKPVNRTDVLRMIKCRAKKADLPRVNGRRRHTRASPVASGEHRFDYGLDLSRCGRFLQHASSHVEARLSLGAGNRRALASR